MTIKRNLTSFALGFALGAFLVSPPARAQMIPGVRLVPLGYCQLVAPNTATLVSSCAGFSTFLANGANVMIVRADTQAIRWRDDGTSPSATVGMPLLVADPPFLYSGTLANVSVISSTAGANVNITFYKSP